MISSSLMPLSKVFRHKEEIETAVTITAAYIVNFYLDHPGTKLVIIPILNGGMLFGVDLIKATGNLLSAMDESVTYDTMSIRRYTGVNQTKETKVLKLPNESWNEGYTVVLVDDIYDKGVTAERAVTNMLLTGMDPDLLLFVSLINKRTEGNEYIIEENADYTIRGYSPIVCKRDSIGWLYGYGMDLMCDMRGLTAVHDMVPEKKDSV